MRALLLALLLLAPTAAAREPGRDYSEEAAPLVSQLDKAVVRARVATVEHAFGDRTARETAHAMRVEGARIEALLLQLSGLEPTRQEAREHAAVLESARWYHEGLHLMEDCFRHRGPGPTCAAAELRISWAELYREAARDVLERRGKAFS